MAIVSKGSGGSIKFTGTGGGISITSSGGGGGGFTTSGLVLHLDAGNPASYPGSGTVWTDLSGYGNNATLTNGPTFNSANGGSILFDGSNDYAPTSTNGFPFGSAAGTISTWVKASQIDNNYRWVFAYGLDVLGASRFLGFNGSTYYFGGYGDDITAPGFSSNTWVNLTGVYNGTTASMYVNGVLVAGATNKSWNTINNVSTVGRQTNGGEYFNGKIAQVLVYNRALSDTEILNNFNAVKSRFIRSGPASIGGLAAWYKADSLTLMNGATVTSLVDSSGAGNDMTSYSGTPTYNASDAQFGGKPSISFNAGSYLYKDYAAELPEGNGSFTIYVVGYVSSQHLFGIGGNSNYGGNRVSFAGGGGSYGVDYGSATGAGPVAGSTTSPVILSISKVSGADTTSVSLYCNNVLGTPGGQAGYALTLPSQNGGFGISPAHTTIGTLPGAPTYSPAWGTGKFAEALVYNTQHDNTARLQVTQYLATKYGISI
jgi:hypothetical protein